MAHNGMKAQEGNMREAPMLQLQPNKRSVKIKKCARHSKRQENEWGGGSACAHAFPPRRAEEWTWFPETCFCVLSEYHILAGPLFWKSALPPFLPLLLLFLPLLSSAVQAADGANFKNIISSTPSSGSWFIDGARGVNCGARHQSVFGEIS